MAKVSFKEAMMRYITHGAGFAFALVFSVFSGQASAAVLSADYTPGSGDGWITIDSSTGLKWLDVSLTIGQTFDEVRTGAWYSKGFRHATKEELRTLFANAGTPDDGFNLAISHPAETLELAQLLGPTLVDRDRVTVAGFLGTDFLGQDITLASHPVGQSFSAQLGKIDYLTTYGEAHFTGGHPFSNQANNAYGSFLVSSVPEPGTYATMLLGLVGVLTLARRRKATAHRHIRNS
ncbi:PEP-CTERM sorting domain-containing protein [Methyloversatilis sp. XJ19-49]|uniref:PEP-CTERM sorting domain-containing protein n=1 Tax=Methyloversatilis sp. XJ19-49 TaxID=2963429 RepID=UPI00211CA55D|nr:PEP-CTERM sorting domain-containing protein [Methyloversatilis sp. XJ19-49]MCQ9378897.1 PEP-CTERM sorting domain-containing protein [Methyloversatilis sp. XJ19-49]